MLRLQTGIWHIVQSGLGGLLVLFMLLIASGPAQAQNDSLFYAKQKANLDSLAYYTAELRLLAAKAQQAQEKAGTLQVQLQRVQKANLAERQAAELALKEEEDRAKEWATQRKDLLDTLRKRVFGYPVLGPQHDTLYYLYAKSGTSLPSERAVLVTEKIKKLYQYDQFRPDSLKLEMADDVFELIYDGFVIARIVHDDTLWTTSTAGELANGVRKRMTESIVAARSEHSRQVWLWRAGKLLAILAGLYIIFRLLNAGYRRLLALLQQKGQHVLHDISYKGYVAISGSRLRSVIATALKVVRWLFILLLVYGALTLIFTVLPDTRGWASILVHLVADPLRSLALAIWHYLPNLVVAVLISFIMYHVIRFTRLVFTEISRERLKVPGFYAEWAMPTFSIVKVVLVAFTFVVIFPYLPGSGSELFKGVSVFFGLLLSLGASSAVANVIAGLVITYMRPFKVGDVIQAGDVKGSVIEKSLLVTRLRTFKNEMVTIPNSTMLLGNMTNYSTDAAAEALIVHTTVTIGYDVPWRDMHQALLEAASRCDLLQQTPAPFVLQTSLDDFYVSYQINAHTRQAARLPQVYSQLHQHIQDACNERGIEIMSPHYRAARDGNATTIPAEYLAKDYKAPSFNVSMDKDK